VRLLAKVMVLAVVVAEALETLDVAVELMAPAVLYLLNGNSYD
jgi:hypothetical protein